MEYYLPPNSEVNQPSQLANESEENLIPSERSPLLQSDTNSRGSEKEYPTAKTRETLPYSHFMFNRLVRVLPVYYVCILLLLPTFYAGFTQTCNYHDTTETIETYFTNFIPSSTWFLSYLGTPFDVPAWTVQTLIGMWLLFPSILRYYHNKSDTELLQWIVYSFWIQMILCIGLTYGGIYVLHMGDVHAICLGRYHPLSRIWCFNMGVLSGILCLRYKSKGTMPWFDDANWFFPFKSTM